METLNSQGQNHLMPTFLLLGAARLVDDQGFTCAVPYDKVQALAIWLAMEPDAHTRTQLAQWLWPASSADQARRLASKGTAWAGLDEGRSISVSAVVPS